MFAIQKGRSRNTDVEYLELPLSEVLAYMEAHEPRKTTKEGRSTFQRYEILLTDHALLKLERSFSAKEKLVEITIGIITWGENKHDCRNSGIWINPEGKREGGYNRYHMQLNVEDHYSVCYVVMDGGFSEYNPKITPYFLSPAAFEYIFERII